MRRSSILSVAVICFCVTAVRAAEGDTLWTRTYGGPGNDWANSIIPSDDGGFLLAGWTNVWTGNDDLWLVKLDVNGDSLWSRTYEGSNGGALYSIAPSDDGGFLLAGGTNPFGTHPNDFLLMKLNSNGDSLWSRTYGGASFDWAYSIIPSGDGCFLIAGETNSYGAGDGDIWLLKVDANGDSVWSHTYGGDAPEVAYCIIPSGDNGFLLAGETYSFSAGLTDMWLVKVNSSGDSLWSHSYGEWEMEVAYSIVPACDGGFLLVGCTRSFSGGDENMWLVKVNANGDYLWSCAFGGSNDDGAHDIVASGGGGFLLTGWTNSYGVGGSDMWLLKVNAQGDSLWSRTYGAGSQDAAFSIISSGDGNFLLAGETSSYSVGYLDMWLVKVEGPDSTAVEPTPSIQPLAFFFHPPHPNPFNPSTVLSFELRVPSLVKLEVFDINGCNVGARHAVPSSGSGTTPTMYNAGTHQIPFDGADLPSGIYFAKLTTIVASGSGPEGGLSSATPTTAVQKLVLLK